MEISIIIIFRSLPAMAALALSSCTLPGFRDEWVRSNYVFVKSDVRYVQMRDDFNACTNSSLPPAQEPPGPPPVGPNAPQRRVTINGLTAKLPGDDEMVLRHRAARIDNCMATRGYRGLHLGNAGYAQYSALRTDAERDTYLQAAYRQFTSPPPPPRKAAPPNPNDGIDRTPRMTEVVPPDRPLLPSGVNPTK